MTRRTPPRLLAVLAAFAALFLSGIFVGAGTASAAPSTQDQSWMVAAHQSNLTEIAAGQAAQSKASSQAVKDLGAMFVTMHTTLDASLTAAAQSFGVTLPSTPNAAQQATLASVGAKSGDAFDTAWTTAQIAGHREALSATQKEISSGSDATVIQLANTTAPVVQQHLTSLLALPQAPASAQAGTGGQAASSPWPTTLAGLGLALFAASVLTPKLARRRR